MSTDTSLLAFKAISNFTNELSEVFSESHRPLKLYAHLINKTTLACDQAIQKHFEAFNSFCVSNRDAISERNVGKLNTKKISYSKRVWIDMGEIFKLADSDSKSVIWKHLLTISALVDPSGKARQILKEQKEKGNGGEEINFLTDIISKVENKVSPNSNPMEAVSSIMQSGIFTELVQGMGNGLQNGSLDLNKLMGTVQTMVTKLSHDAGDDEGGEQAMNMINTMMGNLTNNTKQQNGPSSEMPMPDISSMMGPMFAMMGNMTNMGGKSGGMPDLAGMLSGMAGNTNNMAMDTKSSSNAIECKINEQVRAAKESGDFNRITDITVRDNIEK